MEYAQIVFYQLVIFVIYGAIGVAAVKGGILDEAGLHAVSQPCSLNIFKYGI